MTKTKKIIIFTILALIPLVIVSPLLTILALNTLFGLSVKYTIGTYFATLWLSMLVWGSSNKSK